MIIKTLVLGELETNCYLIIKDKDCLIVDPACDFNLIKEKVSNLNLVAILVTHYHFDHIGALKELETYYNVPVYDYHSNSTKVAEFDFEIIHNPGHTEDSVTFYFPKYNIMFVGDFIFKNSIGRTDLKGGNNLNMNKSLAMIKKYPDNTILYPGHGPSTTLKDEKDNNFYLKKQS